MRVAHQSIIVTGAGNGIGREIAVMMAKQGAKVIITDVNAEKGAETEKRLAARGPCKFL